MPRIPFVRDQRRRMESSRTNLPSIEEELREFFALEEEFEEPEPNSSFDRPWSVTDLNRYLRGEIEQLGRRIWVEGEISGLKIQQSSGHAYFDLKDRKSYIPCVFWRDDLRRIRFTLNNGLAVILEAKVTVYEARGRLQLRGFRAEPMGEGALLFAFRQRVEKLRQEGLFDPARLKPIALCPRKIGVVTSPEAAAFKDVLRTVYRRDPQAHVLLSPTIVQGPKAARSIVKAIQLIDEKECDVILLVRGGGSLEDLQAFNEEEVARAVVAAQTPVITGVGHEIDTTLVDYVADARGSTPSTAAELAVKPRQELFAALDGLVRRLKRGMRAEIARHERRLRYLQQHLVGPSNMIFQSHQQIDDLLERSRFAIHAKILNRARWLNTLRLRLESHQPIHRIEQRKTRLVTLGQQLTKNIRERITYKKNILDELQLRLNQALEQKLESDKQQLLSFEQRLEPAVEHQFVAARERLHLAIAKLDALSPLSVFKRGYAVVQNTDGQIIKEVGQVSVGESVEVRLAEGRIWAQVTELSDS